ncbi:MAG: hypothetical protein N2202_00395 [Proteobacteria bacterium]|nr:hypothetical protein [Pseudomonadota bacterium]
MKVQESNKQNKKCLICGKESKENICKTCENKIQAEAFYKKKKEEGEKK